MLAAGMALWAVWPELCRSFGAHGGPEGQAPSAHPAGEGAGSVATRGLPSASAPALACSCTEFRGQHFHTPRLQRGTCVRRSFPALSLSAAAFRLPAPVPPARTAEQQ